jgi:hypothetical protein
MVDFAESFRWLGDKTGLREKAEYQTVPRRGGLQLKPGDLLTLGVDDTKGNIARLGLVGMDDNGEVNVQAPRIDTKIYNATRNESSDRVIVPKDMMFLFGRHDPRMNPDDPRHFALCNSLPVARVQFTLNGNGLVLPRGYHETLYSIGGDQDTWSKEAILNEGEEQGSRHVAGSEKALVQVRNGAVILCSYPELVKNGRRNQISTQRDFAPPRRQAVRG